MLDRERWAAASSYALSFVNVRDCSREADRFNYRILVLRVLAAFAAGQGRSVDALFRRIYAYLRFYDDRDGLRRLLLSMRSDATKSSILYRRIKPKAVADIMDLVAKCPELKGKTRLPRGTFHPAYGMGQPSAVALLHLRRVDRFLKHQGLHRTADRLERESLVHFDAAHLQALVKGGRWGAAWYYLRRFSPLWEPEGEGTNQQYTSLLRSLSDDSMLAFLACRGDEGGRAASLMFPGPSSRAFPSDDAFRNKFPETIKRHDLWHSMTSAQARASVDWENIKLRTLEKIEELLRGRPDLKSNLRMRLPQRVPALSEIIPLRLRGPKRHKRKRVGRKPACELAHFLLHIQKRLPSSQDTDQSSDSGLSSGTLTLANEAKASDISLSAANIGIKRARSQDDCYTETSNHGPKECYKRPRRFGDVDMKQESDFSR